MSTELSPTPRVSSGLSDAYTDILGGEYLQVSRRGSIDTATYVVDANRCLTIPGVDGGGNVTYVRGVWETGVVFRYDGFMSDISTSRSAGSIINLIDTSVSSCYVNNLYSVSSGLTTVIQLTSSAIVGNTVQVYYSHRSINLSVKGSALSGWPDLHTGTYQGTANDGDNYIMMALLHAYRVTSDTKYSDMLSRIGNAMIEAGSFSGDLILFNIPLGSAETAYGLYYFHNSITSFAWQLSPSLSWAGTQALRITTLVTPRTTAPYNYAGFGSWITIPLINGEIFNSFSLAMNGDGSGRRLPLTSNIYLNGSSTGDVSYSINMCPTLGATGRIITITKSDFWITKNVIFDAQHKEFGWVTNYNDTLGSTSTLSNVEYASTTEPNNPLMLPTFTYTKVTGGWAGISFSAPIDNSIYYNNFNFDIYNVAVVDHYTITATDIATIKHSCTLETLNILSSTNAISISIPFIGVGGFNPQQVTALVPTNVGSGYPLTTTVTITGDGAGATAKVNFTGGLDYIVGPYSQGSNITWVWLGISDSAGGSGATAIGNIAGGDVIGLDTYTVSAPGVTWCWHSIHGVGSSTSATASNTTGLDYITFAITSGGAGYTSAYLSYSWDNGSGTINCIINPTYLASITVTNPGSGYIADSTGRTLYTTMQISSDGVTPTLHVPPIIGVLVDGTIPRYTITNPGSGYTYASCTVITPGLGSGATATVSVSPPITHPITSFSIEAINPSGTFMINNIRYDTVTTMDTISPPADSFNGWEINFPSHANQYDIYISGMYINRTIVDGPTTDTLRYQGIPRWTYKWDGYSYGTWRGPSAVGYNWLGGWSVSKVSTDPLPILNAHNPSNMHMGTQMLLMMYDSQQKYKQYFPYSTPGLFMPRYGREGWESLGDLGYMYGSQTLSSNTMNKWYFPGTDDWYGYMVRALLSVANYYYLTRDSYIAKPILDYWMSWINQHLIYDTVVTGTFSSGNTITFTSAHGLTANRVIVFSSSTVPAGVIQHQGYYVKTIPTSTSITISTYPNGVSSVYFSSGNTSNVRGVTVGTKWRAPSEYKNNGTSGYSYNPIYNYTCMAAACIYKYWVDGDSTAYIWYRRLLDSLYTFKITSESGNAIVASAPLTGNSSWNNETARQRIDNTVITNPDGLTQIWVSIQAGTGIADINKAYIGVAATTGDPFDFASTPSQITFNNGSASVVINSGSTIISDAITISIPNGSSILISMYLPSASNLATLSTNIGWQGYYKSGDDAITTNATGYSSGQAAYGIALISQIATIGKLQGISRTTEGSGYTTATVNITGNGTGAVATAFITGGKITHYEVTNQGSGYTNISASVVGNGAGATCNAYLTTLMSGAYSTAPTGWEHAEIYNTIAMLVLGSRPGGTVTYPITPTTTDITNLNDLEAFYARCISATRPSMLTSTGMPMHEFDIDPYHEKRSSADIVNGASNGGGIENPLYKDTHAKGAMWTETIGPTFYMAIEFGRRYNDYTWANAIYSLICEFTGMANNPSLRKLYFYNLDGSYLGWTPILKSNSFA